METVPAEEGRCAYRWTITDAGVGMSEELLQRIFEPFAQEKNDARSVYQGTGLGMAIVKSLVEKMNGTIRVESRLGEGSTFTVTIPFDIAPPPETQPALERADAGSIPIIAMTANAFQEDAQECLRAGMNALLSKPLDMDKLVRTLSALCRGGEEH